MESLKVHLFTGDRTPLVTARAQLHRSNTPARLACKAYAFLATQSRGINNSTSIRRGTVLPAVPTSDLVTTSAAYLIRQSPWTPTSPRKQSRVQTFDYNPAKQSPSASERVKTRWEVMLRAAGVVSRQYRGGGKERRIIGGKLQKRKARPLQSCPLPSALPLTEIASEAGPTKNSLDSTRTLRTIVFLNWLTPIGRTLQPIRAWFPLELGLQSVVC